MDGAAFRIEEHVAVHRVAGVEPLVINAEGIEPIDIGVTLGRGALARADIHINR